MKVWNGRGGSIIVWTLRDMERERNHITSWTIGDDSDVIRGG